MCLSVSALERRNVETRAQAEQKRLWPNLDRLHHSFDMDAIAERVKKYAGGRRLQQSVSHVIWNEGSAGSIVVR